uniref:CHK kinase-like domain-containing protein n=1 Tax=Acrobeloides nanus TaxID=290746 RepID=A0A914E6V9_9BILA
MFDHVEANDITHDKGFASRVYQVKLFASDPTTPFYTFIMKIPRCGNELKNIDELTNKMFEGQENKNLDESDSAETRMVDFHNAECDFYDYFSEVPGFPVPKVYYAQKSVLEKNQLGVIFMEDLSEISKTMGFVKSLMVDQVKLLVEHLAAFHAFQICEEKPKWEGKFNKCAFIDEKNDIGKSAIEGLKVFKDGIFAKEIVKFYTVITDPDPPKYIVRGICDNLGLPSVVCIGDMHTNNILWQVNKNGEILDKVQAIIDFQVAFQGSPAFDLARILMVCTDGEIRRELEPYIFDYYMEKITERMSKVGKEPSFTVNEFKKAYEFGKIHQALTVAILVPFFTAMGTLQDDDEAGQTKDEKSEILIHRAKLGLEDAVKALEELAPQWISR